MKEEKVNKTFAAFVTDNFEVKTIKGVCNPDEDLRGDVPLGNGCQIDHQFRLADMRNILGEGMGDGGVGDVWNHVGRLLTSMNAAAADGGAYFCLPIKTWNKVSEDLLQVLEQAAPWISKHFYFFVVTDKSYEVYDLFGNKLRGGE